MINTGTHLKFDCGCEFALTNDPYLENLNRESVDIDLENIPVNCWKTWHLIGTGRVKGVFQLESRLGQNWAKELKPESLEHMSALGALLRPGCLNNLDDQGVSVTKHYCLRKNGKEKSKIFHPSIEEPLRKSYSLMIYQEQSMKIAQIVAGFNLMEADLLRRAVGKKKASDMAKVKKLFIEKARDLKIVTEKEAQDIFSWIQESQRYQFNASHSRAYAVNGYMSAYIKCHFLVEFYCAFLRYAKDRKPKPKIEVQELVNEAKINNIDIYTPDIRDLKLNFEIKSPTRIDFGLANVGGIGETTANKFINLIRDLEKDHGALAEWSWYKFLCLVAPNIGRTTIINWISVGALRHFGMSRRSMISEFKEFKDLFKTAKGELAWIEDNWQNYTCLTDMLQGIAKPKKEGGGVHGAKRIPVIDSVRTMLLKPSSSTEDDPNEIAVIEEFLLGISITCSRSDGKPGERSNITCKEFLDGTTLPYMIFKVHIDEVKEHIINKGKEENIGKTMAFVKMSDSSCRLDNVTIFADQYEGNEEEGIEGYKNILTPGRILEIRAEAGKKKGGLIIQDVWEI